jgi:hypothetical protein
MYRIRVALLVVVASVLVIAGCGGSATSPSQATSALALRVYAGAASLLRYQGGSSQIEYRFCYELTRTGPTQVVITITDVVASVIGPDLFLYGSFPKDAAGVTSTSSQYPIVFGGCTFFRDSNLARPVAGNYQIRVDYMAGSASQSLHATGTFVNNVPTWPLMTGLKVTNDINDPQNILRSPRPVTFTATGEGGVPPYEFQWRINGFLLRDWSKDPTLVWDGMLNGSAAGRGAYLLAVGARSNGGTDVEAGTQVTVFFQF